MSNLEKDNGSHPRQYFHHNKEYVKILIKHSLKKKKKQYTTWGTPRKNMDCNHGVVLYKVRMRSSKAIRMRRGNNL